MYPELFPGWQHPYILPQYLNIQPFNYNTIYLNPAIYGELSSLGLSSFYRTQIDTSNDPSSLNVQSSAEKYNLLQRIQPQSDQRQETCISKKKKKQTVRRRTKPKHNQKQDRNVVSNLLKIFLKNLLDLQKWDYFIKNFIQKSILQTSAKRFYDWVFSFRMNYKNYIKTKEIAALLSVQNCQAHQKIFRVVFLRFLNSEALLHSLTARRIDRQAARRHVERLRGLKQLVAQAQT